ncbi:MAG: hypothetical protein AB1758_20095 [Candidatus Eremiobacterota bacterium]
MEASQLQAIQGAELSLALTRVLALPDGGRHSAVRPAYHLARVASLSADVRVLVDHLLESSSELDEAISVLLLLRSACLELGRQLRLCLEPVETLMQDMEAALKGSRAEPARSASDPNARNVADRDRDETRLRQELRRLGASEEVAQALASRLAETGRLSRVMAELVLALQDQVLIHGTRRLDAVLTALVEVQVILDVELRRLLLEEQPGDESPCFEVGLLPWISMFLAEAGRKLAARET